MPRNVRLHKLSELVNDETTNEILLDTNPSTELHIVAEIHRTIIKLPYGNKFDIIDGCMVIYK